MKKLNLIVFNLILIGFSLSSWGEIKFIQSTDGNISEVPANKVESTCGKNFVFREIKKEETPEYLQKEIIKAAFKGEMSPSIEAVISTLKANKGKCAWVVPEELEKAKQL